jgi:hypothetical protein
MSTTVDLFTLDSLIDDEGYTMIFRAEDERPDWQGWSINVLASPTGDITVHHEGPRKGPYPGFPGVHVKRQEIPSLIAALARSLV